MLAGFLDGAQNTIIRVAWLDWQVCTMQMIKASSWSKAMTRAGEVILYTQPDCHLCELAEQMLEQCDVNWYAVDIEADPELLKKYGIHVPVLYRTDVDRELYWPFTVETVSAFIELEI